MKLTNTEKQTITDAAIKYVSSGKSQSQLARLCDVSKANISHIVSGNWQHKSISDAIWLQVHNALGLQHEGFDFKLRNREANEQRS